MSDTLNQFMGGGGGGGGDGASFSVPASNGSPGADVSGYQPDGGSGSNDVYSSLKMGGSAVAALSKFGLAMSKATDLSSQADQSRMQASQEFLNAQAASNEIQRRFTDTIGAQTATAAAGNVDVASGSVQEAGRQAALTAGRADTAIRNQAAMNAAMRRARAYALQQQAGMARFGAVIGLGGDIANMVMQAGGGG